ncbi:uncharacterized protein FFB20_11455 [Fusarium fujikuroi]|nr:uncharacterized protein FFB20_11455 [Fusarium fujikuroi]
MANACAHQFRMIKSDNTLVQWICQHFCLTGCVYMRKSLNAETVFGSHMRKWVCSCFVALSLFASASASATSLGTH